jgi:hypothetical protein
MKNFYHKGAEGEKGRPGNGFPLIYRPAAFAGTLAKE